MIGQRSPAYEPDEHETKHRRKQACHAQRGFRTLDRGCREALGGGRERREQQAFDDKHETDCNKELGHRRADAIVTARVGCYFAGDGAGAASAGTAGLRPGTAPSRDLPEGSPK